MTTRLMFDRRWIVNHAGPCRARGEYGFRVAAPAKPEAPVLLADRPWESMALGWGTLLYEEGRFRLWYEAWDENYRDDFDGRLCYAESGDGVHWEKPCLRLVEYGGSKDNNIVFEGRLAGGLGFHGHYIFVDPSSPEEARYRMIFMGAVRRWDDPSGWYPAFPMSFAYSADGLRWRWGLPEAGSWLNPPITPFGSDTQSVVHWDPGKRRYVGYFRTWEPGYGRCIGRAETSDFGRWPYPETILSADESDPFGCDLYNNAATRYEVPGDTGHFFFISVFDHDSDTLTVQLATSRDGRRYQRLAREPFVAPTSEYDRGGAYMCPGVHRIGDDLVMMYHAVPFRHGEARPDRIRYAGGYVLLRFPQDRFQGLHAPGSFEFNVPAERGEDGSVAVTLNAVVETGGAIRGGLMKAADNLEFLPGFSPDDCLPVTGDAVHLPLSWRGGAVPPGAAGEPLELRLYLDRATLYSISFA